MTAPAAFADHFSGHAPDYRTYRPNYPTELFAYLKSVVPHGRAVWDCGTGNGQAAVALADHFPTVFATDPSAEQIAQAESHPNVAYAVAPAEACPLPDASVDLVTVAQALHWFDFDRFYAEVRRVTRPAGVVAAWGYYQSRVNVRVDAVLSVFKDQILSYWPGERGFVESAYTTIPFPFAEIDVSGCHQKTPSPAGVASQQPATSPPHAGERWGATLQHGSSAFGVTGGATTSPPRAGERSDQMRSIDPGEGVSTPPTASTDGAFVPRFAMTAHWTLAELLGYLNTASATKRFIKAHGFNPVERLATEFAAAWGDPAERRTVTWDLFLRIGRVG